MCCFSIVNITYALRILCGFIVIDQPRFAVNSFNGRSDVFFVFQGHTESNIYEITIPFICRHTFCGKFNLQLFKAVLLVMNYFVTRPLMRFIFNNCNNYFIKKKEKPCIMAISARSTASRDSHQEGIITPAGLSFTPRLKLHYVSTMCALNLSSHIYQFFPLSLAAYY